MKEIKGDKQKIKDLRRAARLKQASIPFAFKEFGLKTSLRNYQRAEKGESVSLKYLTSVAQFFDQYLKKYTAYNKPVSLEDITKTKSINNKKNKTVRSGIFESCYLYSLASEEKLTEIIKRSTFRKIFYNVSLPPKSKEAKIVTDILRDIHSVHKESKSVLKKSETESYFALDKEIEALNSVSDFEQNIKELEKLGIYLYAGNFQLNTIAPIIMSGSEKLERHPGYANQMITTGSWVAGITKKDYAIFSFYKPFKSSLLFNYENYWSVPKLQNILDDLKFNTSGYEWDAEQYLDAALSDTYKYTDKIDKNKVSITAEHASGIDYSKWDYNPGEDPGMDEYMKRTGKTYAEVMEEAEDQYAQMEIDRIRGK